MTGTDTEDSLRAEWDSLSGEEQSARLSEFKQRKAALAAGVSPRMAAAQKPAAPPPGSGQPSDHYTDMVNAADIGMSPKMAAAQPPARQQPDKVAPGGLTGVVTGQKDEPGAIEALARGARSGVTLGFYDEGAGAVKALAGRLFGDDQDFAAAYRRERDLIRQEDGAAQEAHPYLYGAGEIAGGFATPGFGFVGGVARVGKTASRIEAAAAAAAQAAKAGAKYGAVSGLGHSDAEDVGGMARDTLAGGASGAIAGGVLGGIGGFATRGRVGAGATERVQRDINEDIAGNAPATQAKKVALSSASDIMQEPQNKALRGSLKDTDRASELATQRLKEEGAKLGPLYEQFDKAAGGADVAKVVGELLDEAAKYKNKPGTEPIKSALNEMADDVYNSWKDAPGGRVPTAALREYATNVQNAASRTMGSINETAQFQLKKDLEVVVKGILDRHLDSAPEVADVVKQIRDVNRQYSGLKATEGALDARENKDLVRRPKNAIGKAVAATGLGAAGAMAAEGNYAGAAGLGAMAGLSAAAPVLRRGADRFLAAAVKAADEGNPWAKIVDRIVALGAPLSVAEQVADQVSQGGRPPAVKARPIEDDEPAPGETPEMPGESPRVSAARATRARGQR